MKKVLVMALALAVALASFAGCSGTVTNESQSSSANPVSAETSESAEASSLAEGSYTIGVTQIVEHESLDVCRQGALDKLAELGYVEGENLTVQFENAQNDVSVATTIAQQFVSDKVDAILAITTPSAQAAYAAAMGKVPVVFSAISAPVSAGLAAEDGSTLPGVTGTSDAMPIAETLELIRSLLPDAVSVGILHNTSEVNSDVQLAQAKELAADYGMTIVDAGITSTNEMASALDALLPQVDAVMNLTDNMVVSALALEIEKCNEAGIALFGSEYTQVENGALASAGVDYYALGQQTGAMIAAILEGQAPEEIAIETIEGADVYINSDVAAVLGITVPDELNGAATLVTTKTEDAES